MHTVFTLQSVSISDPQASDNYKEKMETKVPMPLTMDPDKMFGPETAQAQ